MLRYDGRQPGTRDKTLLNKTAPELELLSILCVLNNKRKIFYQKKNVLSKSQDKQ